MIVISCFHIREELAFVTGMVLFARYGLSCSIVRSDVSD